MVHGIFEQQPHIHYRFGCPKCSCSRGEKVINDYLTINNINFVSKKRFSNCKNKSTLPFDFYVESMNLCIEFDGRQHFEPVDWFGGIDTFNTIQQNDAIKTNYCKENNINLLRLTYKDFNDKLIKIKLDDYLDKLVVAK